jgi:hypothetical protein
MLAATHNNITARQPVVTLALRPIAPAARPRAEIEAEYRAMVVTLGAMWLRENGPPKYGKARLSGVSDAELSAIHAAAIAETAKREADSTE